jgi:diguanylate cyclase (GGDEF)-like protein
METWTRKPAATTATTGMQARAAARGHARVLRRSIVLLVAAMLGLAGVSAVLVLDASSTLQRVQRQTNFNSAVPTLRSIIETLLSAEAAQRAFLLTGHQNFLTTYAEDITALAKHVDATQKLFPVDAHETRQLDRVGYLVQQKQAEMNQAVRVFQKGDSAGAVASVKDKVWVGYTHEIRTILNAIIDKGQQEQYELTRHIADGAQRAQTLLVVAVSLLVLVLALAIYQVRTMVRANAAFLAQLDRDATQDALTGLSNRRLFTAWLERSVALANRQQRQLAVIFIDLDGFKAVNDTCGHEAGDQLLQRVAGALRQTVRQSDLVARLGGDEFAILASEGREAIQLGRLTERLLKAVITAASQDARIQTPVSASIGVAIYPADADTPGNLLDAADAAMYAAKKGGKNKVRFAREARPVQQA